MVSSYIGLQRRYPYLLLISLVVIICSWMVIRRQGNTLIEKQDIVEQLTLQIDQANMKVSVQNNEILQLKDHITEINSKVHLNASGQIISNTSHLLKWPLLKQINLPSADMFLPHLANKPKALVPAVKIGKNKLGATIVIGIPTVKRAKESYLLKTVQSLLDGMTEEEKQIAIIVIFIAETDTVFVEKLTEQLQSEFQSHINRGLLEIIAPPAAYYPDLTHLPRTLGDTVKRVRWRTKQNLDYAFLMSYSIKKGLYYVQLEDDVISAPNCVTKMKDFALRQRDSEWFVLLFSTLGFIGRFFRTRDLGYVVNFMLMFHKDQPCDWLLDHVLYSKVCSTDKSLRHCTLQKQRLSKRHRPSLFQHIGRHSSLAGKIQPLRDKGFRAHVQFLPHKNPPATTSTNIKHHQKYSFDAAYNGRTVFWGIKPKKGDYIIIKFEQPIEVNSISINSGSGEHPGDILNNAVVSILLAGKEDKKENYNIIGKFAHGAFHYAFNKNVIAGKIKVIKIEMLENSNSWIVFREVHIKV